MRAFIALEPDPPAHDVLAGYLRKLRQASFAHDVKWVSEDNVHMTMRFLGEIDEAQKMKLLELLSAALPALPSAPSLRMREPQLFPRPAQARIITCRVERDAWLDRLAAACEHFVQAIGLPAERRPFSGHITLGRTKDTFEWRTFEPWPAAISPLKPAHLTLFKSTLTPRGPIYEVLARFECAGYVN